MILNFVDRINLKIQDFVSNGFITATGVVSILSKRTDLAMEAHELWRTAAHQAQLPGIHSDTHMQHGYEVTTVCVTDEESAKALGKPKGTYVTLDLRPYWSHEEGAFERAARAVGTELRALLGKDVKSALVTGLGNDAMTPDAIGPSSAEHVLVTRHLMHTEEFSSLAAVSVLTPGVLGRTGMEAAEVIRGAVKIVRPDVLIAVDALASRSLARVCTTVQLSDTGMIPGSGVGNRRRAVNQALLHIPVIALGVPTVVDAATLAADLLEEAGTAQVDPAALRGQDAASLMVTPRDIDAQIAELSRIVGYGINLALHPLSFEDLTALLG